MKVPFGKVMLLALDGKIFRQESRNGVFMWDSVLLCAMKRKSLVPMKDIFLDELSKPKVEDNPTTYCNLKITIYLASLMAMESINNKY